MLGFLHDLTRPPKGMEVDFSLPKGEPALAAPGSVSWRIFRNPISLFVGGVAAVLLELAEPSVRAGVWDHSNFRRDPAGRLRRTGYAAMVTVYGPRSAAEAMIATVVRMHDKVTGETADGRPYRANDPRLLDWVQATAIFGFAQAYDRFVYPLSDAEKDKAFAEGAPAARLYGASGAPTSWGQWQLLLAGMTPSLEASDIIAEFLDIMATAEILPAPLRPLQRLLVRAAVDISPDPVRAMPQLQRRGLRVGEPTLVRALGRAANLVQLPGTPPTLAAKRMASGSWPC